MHDISSFLFIPNGSRVFPLSITYSSPAFRTLSLLLNCYFELIFCTLYSFFKVDGVIKI